MTPAARLQTAAEILDAVLAGEAAEKALTNWARASRYAGSKDRAAVRDHVYEALRCMRSYAAHGGAMSGRGLMLGALRVAGVDPADVYTGEGHGPAALSAEEAAFAPAALSEGEALDMPDWLVPVLHASLKDVPATCAALRQRAPAMLRVNLMKTDMEQAVADLSSCGIQARPHGLSPTALEVTAGARQIAGCAPYTDGLVELQDGASQAVVDTLPLRDGMTVLDYCAGGGGKTLAMAARAKLRLFAHDAEPRRMKDLSDRAARAGVTVAVLDSTELAAQGPFDLVLCDAPCSGSGAWRRSPEGKWALTPERLDALTALQSEILEAAQALVAPGGTLAYATCSLLAPENAGSIAAFLARHPDWQLAFSRQWSLADGGDGFYVAHLTRA